MRRILFVDDEPRILEGMRRVLRSRRDEWEAVFISSPTDALLECNRTPFDIVVSDMRMPEMDGATFLGAIAEQWPGTVRLVLTGQTDARNALMATRVAHQFIAKPCEAAALQAVLDRACLLRDLITDPIQEAIVGSAETLPTVPAVYRLLTELLSQDEVTVTDVAAVVERDASLAAKVLQLVNSSFFGPSREVMSIEWAVSLLGSRLIQSLAMVHGVFRSIEELALPIAFDPKREQAHAIAVGALARRLAPAPGDMEAAFSAGLLHDVGRLLLASRGPDRYDAVVEHADAHGIPMHEAEQAVLGTTHANLGAYALGLWGLPWSIIGAARFHHAPALDPDPAGLAIVIHAADVLVREQTSEGREARRHPAELDEAALAARGFGDAIPRWRELAADLVLAP
ncbi:MAG: HDOD domain-containing protein [Gemmatimonadales bacterium]|nr:HDOD domain-containing protein [Gemmatimonadales bacterium]